MTTSSGKDIIDGDVGAIDAMATMLVSSSEEDDEEEFEESVPLTKKTKRKHTSCSSSSPSPPSSTTTLQLSIVPPSPTTKASTKTPTLAFTVFPKHGLPAKSVKDHMLMLLRDDFAKAKYNVASYIYINDADVGNDDTNTTTIRSGEVDDMDGSDVNEEQEYELDIALLGMNVNLAEQAVYPSTANLHNSVLAMIAKLWNCPTPRCGYFSGTSTIGSTEACFLAGIALKQRWKHWYIDKYNVSEVVVRGIQPNLIISSCYQSCWEKVFRFLDIEPRVIQPSLMKEKMRLPVDAIQQYFDEMTIGVVGILGNHYNGAYDNIYELNQVNKLVSTSMLHGFVVPFLEDQHEEMEFQDGTSKDDVDQRTNTNTSSGTHTTTTIKKPWDFRCNNVLSINGSGHKFGESVCGIGWLVFRHHEKLGEYITTNVPYLGDASGRDGSGDDDGNNGDTSPSSSSSLSNYMSLNFSRPSSALYSQYYKMLRLGIDGYKSKLLTQMDMASMIRQYIQGKKVTIDGTTMDTPTTTTTTTTDDHDGYVDECGSNDADSFTIPLFEIVDCGDLPVVAARLNPKHVRDGRLPMNEYDIQRGLKTHGW